MIEVKGSVGVNFNNLQLAPAAVPLAETSPRLWKLLPFAPTTGLLSGRPCQDFPAILEETRVTASPVHKGPCMQVSIHVERLAKTKHSTFRPRWDENTRGRKSAKNPIQAQEKGTSIDVAPVGACFLPRIPCFRNAWPFLVDFQIDGPAGGEARFTSKVSVSELRRWKAGDGMDLEKERTVVDESDLSWQELVAIQYSVHQVAIPKPLEGYCLGLLQDNSCVSGRRVGP
jgi:hypothetical protein